MNIISEKNNSIDLRRVIRELSLKQKINKKILISDVRDIKNAKKNHITFFTNSKYLELLKKTTATAIIIAEKFKKYVPKKTFSITSQNPELDFAKVSNLFYPESYFSKISYENLDLQSIKKKYKNYIFFGINFYLEKNVVIGKNTFIGNNVTIKKNCKIGNNVVIGSNVVIENCIIGNNTHICDGAIIGKKGFGFKFVKGKCLRIPHVGKVFIGDNCEIGANCVVDRGSAGNTVITKNTFLDNQVHIAHNVAIGENCILAAQVGVAGSTTIGNNVSIGGQSGISGHLTIGNNVKIGGKSGVIKNIKDNEIVMGYPAKPFREFIKENK